MRLIPYMYIYTDNALRNAGNPLFFIPLQKIALFETERVSLLLNTPKDTMSGTSRGPSVSNARSQADQAKQSAAKKSTAPRLVSELPYPTLSKLSSLLDTSRDGSLVMWRKLIEEMPHLKYNVTTVEKFAMNVNQPNGSPSYALLTDMANKGVSYEELITGLKKLNFHTALTAIGHRGMLVTGY